ncbi:MAG: hypothetical protein EA358_04745 [Flavobacteriales bacterium]|nr:MAG: hypothetical protein EA358_04745 [Flavobacteriales bacterium]
MLIMATKLNKKLLKTLSAVLFSAVVFVGCNDFFGDKTDLSFIDLPEFTNRDIAYVPIQPAWDQFVYPTDICIGFDELLYVVDEATQQIIGLDESGREQGRFSVPGVTSVTQDRRFDLLACGTLDTVSASGDPITLACIYRIRLLNQNGQYGIRYARIVNKIIHPFYSRSNVNAQDLTVRFGKVAIMASDIPSQNNRYYVTRQGQGGSSILGPNDAVLIFSNTDQFETPISVSTSSGIFNNFFQKPSGIATYAVPPQIQASQERHFFYSSVDPANELKVQFIEYIETDFGAEFRPVIFPVGDTSRADGFLFEPNKFSKPSAIAVAGDNTRFLFVVDEEKDSLFQFTRDGFEGVLPPPATGRTKLEKASFGGTGNGLTQFNRPSGVGYYRRIVYVADSGNGRILRFRLTLDFN